MESITYGHSSGAFYTCGQQANAFVNRGNVFRYNTVKDVVRTSVPGCQGSGQDVSGFYLE